MGWVVNFTRWPLYPPEGTLLSIEFFKFDLNFDDIYEGDVVILYSSFGSVTLTFVK
jgi:hypothetical protein